MALLLLEGLLFAREVLEDVLWEHHDQDSMNYGGKTCMSRAYQGQF